MCRLTRRSAERRWRMENFETHSITFRRRGTIPRIWAQKFRSLLTMLGIILGVSSLVAMSALVSGMEKGAKEALVAIGGLGKGSIMPQGLPIEQRHLSDQAVGIT